MDSNTLILIAVLLLAWSLIAFVPAVLARSKGRSFAAWWGLGMAIGIFAVIPAATLATARCPHCREVINPGATVCSHCHRDLPSVRPSPVAAVEPAPGLFAVAAGFSVAVIAAAGVTGSMLYDLATVPLVGLVLGLCVVAGTGLSIIIACGILGPRTTKGPLASAAPGKGRS